MAKVTDNRVYAIYSRKSRFTGKGDSVANQIEFCREYIRRLHGDVAADTAVIFEDEGYSGKNLARPGFKKMMEAAESGQLKGIVVYKMDRMSRRTADMMALVDELEAMGVKFDSATESFNNSTASGKAMMGVVSVFSQMERELIAERIQDNMYELSKTGRWLGGTTPLGFESVSAVTVNMNDKPIKAFHLQPVPAETEIVKTIFRLFDETESLTGLEAALLENFVKTRKGNNFSRHTLKTILRNPVYAVADEAMYDYLIEKEVNLFSEKEDFDGVHGIMAYNRTEQNQGKAVKWKPETEWVVSVGQHPGLIDGRTWVKAQKALEVNRSKGYRRPKNNEALLTGVLYCSCGNRMYPKLSLREDQNGNRRYDYVCNLKERSKKSCCNQKNANGNMLDAAVVVELNSLAVDDSRLVVQLEKARHFYSGNRDEYAAQLTETQKTKAEVERKLDVLIDSLVDAADERSKERIHKRIQTLTEESDRLEARIRELEGMADKAKLSDGEFDVMVEMLQQFSDNFDSLTVQQKRQAIQTVVRKVVWDGKNAHVLLFGVEDNEVDFPNLSAYLENLEVGEDEDVFSGRETLLGEHSK